MTPRPFTVHHSAYAKELFVGVIRAAELVGMRAEPVTAALVIERGLMWYADGFGESRQQLQLLGQLRWAYVYPISVWYAVDVARWEVQVSRYLFAPRRPR